MNFVNKICSNLTLPHFSPDGSTIVSSDDSGTVCIWGQNKNIIRFDEIGEKVKKNKFLFRIPQFSD